MMLRKIFLVLLFVFLPSVGFSDLQYARERPGWEEREPEYIKWLAPSVQIGYGVGCGSGTMVYYDRKNNYVYVLSAGHLFNRGRFKAIASSPKIKRIVVFYRNDQRLPRAQMYNAEILSYVWEDNSQDGKPYDVALLRFHPDWKDPRCLPIAPKNYRLIKDKWYHSVGCDKNTEVAHYLVQYYGMSGVDAITRNNAPRGGRSGGGLFTDDGFLVAVCSRSNTDRGVGLWTSLESIHRFLTEEGYGALLKGYASSVRPLPVLDRYNRPTKTVVPTPRLGASSGILLPY